MKDVIARTNRFYIEMSRKVLSEKEYDVLQKLLIEKMTLQEVAAIYGVTRERVRQIYERTYKKVKSVTQLLAEIEDYKLKLEQLKYDFKCETQQIKKRKNTTEIDQHKLLIASHFPFSKRMYSMFEVLDIHTIGQLAEIPLKSFGCFRGFKGQCKKELIAFIEFENIEHLFEGFFVWKTQPIE
nr:sigma factor-like helix-turn-helix DNA-binding protein [Flavobacterium sp.]